MVLIDKLIKNFCVLKVDKKLLHNLRLDARNGICERNHRTIKTIAARSKISITEAVYRYNVTPLDDTNTVTAPGNRMYRHEMRVRGIDPVGELGSDVASNVFEIGDAVWVKNVNNRCFDKYDNGEVTKVLSRQAVEIDGMPRHVRDLRRRKSCNDGEVPSHFESEPDELTISVQPVDAPVTTNQETEAPLNNISVREQANVSPPEDIVHDNMLNNVRAVPPPPVRRGERRKRPPSRYCCGLESREECTASNSNRAPHDVTLERHSGSTEEDESDGDNERN